MSAYGGPVADLDMNQIIHAAVRRDLARTETALRAMRDGDAGRAAALQRAWTVLWRQLHHHHELEDALVWPYLRSLEVLDPFDIDQMEAEHAAMAKACRDATVAIDAVAADPSTARASVAADAVAVAARVTEGHLLHEEKAITPVINERSHTPEWKAVEAQMRKGSPFHAGELFAWIQDGADPEVTTALKSTIPAPVVMILSRVFGFSYHRKVAPVWR